ncbi:EAL domain-containing protein [Actinosynnema sp. NPDC020468]|uniref:putative bifunctional diguanylate cyclase/phosphodiesterase n=1 Tax=Actinosynnema sp. NPDC020468 TaxID=3154488 RepID=UPI0033CBE07A
MNTVGEADAFDFARRWAGALAPTTPGGPPPDRLVGILVRLTGRLPGSGEAVGRSLIGHGFHSGAALERTLVFLGANLPALGVPADRVAATLASVAAGFAEGLRDHTLDQHENSKSLALRSARDAEVALRAGEAKYRAVFHNSAVAIAVTGLDGTLLDFNDALLTLLGHTRDTVGAAVLDLFHPDDRGPLTSMTTMLATGALESTKAERRVLRGDGEVVDVLVAASLVRDEEGTAVHQVLVIQDLAEVRALQVQLLRQSLNDVRTGLANRAQFLGWLEGAVGTRGPDTLALLVFDVDGFRVVNDAFGHEVGNRVLTGVAGHLRRVFDGVGRIARIGADEFGVLVENPVDVATAVTLAEEAVDLLAEPVWVGDHGLGVTASVGIVVRPARGADAIELMRCVDVTVRWAKEDGKAQWALYDRDRDRRDRRRLVLAASVAGGLEQGDFRVDYAPVHSLPDRELVAVEACLRWDHPEYGLLDPPELAGLWSCTGMVVKLGRWALEQACAHAGAWHAEFGAAAPVVSMDLPARVCQEPELVAEVRKALREAGLPAAKLRFELGGLLPSALGDDQVEELNILAEHGVGLVLDQVGGGNIPVDRLRRIALQGVKFAGAPVQGLAGDADPIDESASLALLEWAATLGVARYAAGVRTETEADRLAALGVTAAQGPLFGDRLLTADEVTALLADPKGTRRPD